MNSTALLDDTMTLEEKLAAIDAAMKTAQDAAAQTAKATGKVLAPLDPADLTMCEGCQ